MVAKDAKYIYFILVLWSNDVCELFCWILEPQNHVMLGARLRIGFGECPATMSAFLLWQLHKHGKLLTLRY